jgi:outer membrane protein OmpA-like peptidoglycan-associated protein
MQKSFFLSLFSLLSICLANAQSYLGYTPDNYAGVQSVLFNPASIVDSRFKTDVNLFSISSAVGNDLYGVNFFDVFKKGYDFDLEAEKSFSSANNAFLNMDMMGPSFMFNIAPKHSLAVYTRARALINFIDVNGKVINDVTKDNTATFPTATLGSPNAIGNTWGELGLSYAAVLYQKGQHFLKGGITAKYLQGVANYHFQGTNISVKYDDFGNPLLDRFTTAGSAIYGSSQDFSTNSAVDIDSKSKGFGLDLGLTYEWRPEYSADRADINDLKYLNKYKLRFGISVTDIGSMKYDKGVRNSYDLTGSFTQNDFDGYDNFDDFMKGEFSPTVINGAVKSYLPTALHADVDWNIYKKFYLNANGDLGLVSKTKLNQNTIANRVSLTPRFESKWFSAYIPFSYMDYSKQAQVGVGLRTGFFFIGSSSIISNAISSSSRAADFYLGFKIPVYQKKAKDKDQDDDGILDKYDACPTVAGPVENSGCPWGDKDNDGILDKDDKCPSEAGPVENAGCPWTDQDKDGILDKDDKCPTVAGPKENDGCPWPDTDDDGILDKDDKCPNVKGTVANNGCPEVTTEVIKKLNDFSKSILFDSSKATIKPESYGKLEEIVKVMNEYPNANFKLEGHTDSTGNAVKNLQLSTDRAAAVKDYLIAKGISVDRLSSEGYGITRPIATNNTVEGRAENRRVEIILVK